MTIEQTSLDPQLLRVAEAVSRAGGRALLVGGYVRDRLLGVDSKDYDFEVYGLPLAELEEILARFGEVIRIGRAFGVLRVKGLDVDFSLPRRDSKTGRGHRGFVVELDPGLTFEDAARRRDLTINSIGMDPLSGEILDPHGGRRDLESRRLRPTDAAHFSEDPLRGLRVAQFAARFEMEVTTELRDLCVSLDLSELPGERLFEEFRKLLLKGSKPSLGLAFLEDSKLLRFFPELQATVGVEQDPEWHPEGTVWEHTLMVVDQAAAARVGEDDAELVIMLGALCHDLGKPMVTVEEDGRIRSPRHEEEGVPPTERFLERMRAPKNLVSRVSALVRFHLMPAHLYGSGAKPKAYRRLARKLQDAGVDVETLYRVARADHFGRTTADALARQFPAGDELLDKMKELHAEESVVQDVVMGRHLVARGLQPGPLFGEILAKCRELQDETGGDDPQRILDAVLSGIYPPDP